MRGPPPPLAPDSALFLDFDGTLARIEEDPEAVILPPQAADTLARLEKTLGGAVAILSGRDLRDLSRRAPWCVWRIGGHGVEVCAPGHPPPPARSAAPEALAQAVERLAAAVPGVRVERKGSIIALHYRAAPETGPALAQALAEIVAAFEDYTLQAGKMVLEAKPLSADKGAALSRAMTQAPFRSRTPVMVGDDVTDEDAFRAAQAAGGYGVKVGEGRSAAAYRLPSTKDVWAWLQGAAP
jgi:trehalose 6-phosphate phosphatase